VQILVLIEEQMREDDNALLMAGGRRRSADQYVDTMKMQLMFGVLVRALQFLKLADSSRLPVERTTLKDLLQKWGAFPHIGSGQCPACDAAAGASSDAAPVLAVPVQARVMNIRNVHIDVEKIQVFFPSFPFLPSSLSEARYNKNVEYSADKHVILAFLFRYWFAAVVDRCGE
jgi:hypothetical protein